VLGKWRQGFLFPEEDLEILMDNSIPATFIKYGRLRIKFAGGSVVEWSGRQT